MTIRASREEDLPQIFDIYSKSKLDELQFEVQDFSLVPIEEDSKRLSELMLQTPLKPHIINFPFWLKEWIE